ncbi:hypothetical protein, partial [Vibrio sp.]|uniref:hypothetical protein n=1 Tax=Vibrio sp. TaxID=678 RepID=UPI003F6A746E
LREGVNVADQIVGFRFSSNELRNKAGFTNKYADKFLNKKNDWDKIRGMMLADDRVNELSKLESKLIEFIRLPV